MGLNDKRHVEGLDENHMFDTLMRAAYSIHAELRTQHAHACGRREGCGGAPRTRAEELLKQRADAAGGQKLLHHVSPSTSGIEHEVGPYALDVRLGAQCHDIIAAQLRGDGGRS